MRSFKLRIANITAKKLEDGRIIRINTVDTRKSGKMTTREATNAARIRIQPRSAKSVTS